MFRIFLPLYILLFVYSFFYETLLESFLNEFAEEASMEDATGDFAGAFFMAEKILSEAAPSEWPVLLDKMSAPNIPAKIENLSDYDLSAGEMEVLMAGDILVTDLEEDILIKRFGNSGLVIRFGPVAVVEDLDRTWFFTVMSGSGLLVLLIILWTYSVHRRVKHLSNAAHSFGEGNLNIRAKEAGSIRVGDLNQSFNRMADQIQNLVESHKDLTNAVSHELRTPVSRIRFELDYCQELTTKEEFLTSLDSIGEDVNELDDLISELLTYARFEHNNLALDFQFCELSNWLDEWQRQIRLPNSSLQLETNFQNASFQAQFHEKSLARALDNLVGNATRYANSRILIHASKAQNQAIIRVEDDGQGIPQKYWNTLFDPFVRADKSRSRETGGYGLGLAIVRQIMRRHGGNATVNRSALGGALFELRWPLQDT